VQLGKLVRRGRLNAVVPGKLLHVTDRETKKRFLVNTGASYSILPYQSPASPCWPSLVGPDGTKIPCWGHRRVQLEFDRWRFTWNFLLAAVSFPIIGVDFLKNYKLLVDPANNQLISATVSSCSPPPVGEPLAAAAVKRPATPRAVNSAQVATCGDTALL
jgi:hypothetical protein